jgi:hypothetical protein
MKSNSGTSNRQLKAGHPVNHAGLREAAAEIKRLRLSARRELELARQAREEAIRYQQATATRARSDAYQLVLKERLATNREIEVLRQASEEIQKVLADLSVIRITAQEELAAQRRFMDAARLCSMSSTFNSGPTEAGDKVKQLTADE